MVRVSDTKAKEKQRNERIGWIDDMGQRRILAGVYVAQGKYERALKLLNAGKFEKLFPIRT